MHTHVSRVAVALVLLVAGSRAHAQEVAGTFDQLRVLVKAGDRITVTDDAGREMTGRIAELSPSSLSLLVGSQRHDLQAAAINTIRQRKGDSLANGAKWGFGIGAALGLIGSVAVLSYDDLSDDDSLIAVFASLFYGGVGAGVGVGVDALISSNQVIYARRATTASRISVEPVLTPRRQGAVVVIGF